MKKNLVLIGMMGSGKTTLGKITAKRLNLQFIDTDSNIEKKKFYDDKPNFSKKRGRFF